MSILLSTTFFKIRKVHHNSSSNQQTSILIPSLLGHFNEKIVSVTDHGFDTSWAFLQKLDFSKWMESQTFYISAILVPS